MKYTEIVLLHRLRKAASSAQAQLRQLKARAELKSREAEDSFVLAQAAEEKAQTLEAAGLAQAGPFSPLPYSPSPYSPLLLQSPAMLRGLAGGPGVVAEGSEAVGKGWVRQPSFGALQRDRASETVAVSSSFAGATHSVVGSTQRPSSPADLQARSQPTAGDEEQAQLLQAAW